MTPLTFFGHLAAGFGGFIVAVVITCIVLVKKNGAKYVELQETVKAQKHGVYTDTESDGDSKDEEDE